MNLIVYVSDALRTDSVGCYGARFMRTPTIDAFAAGGVRFDQAISVAPWTCPSTTSMVTGLYPHHHRHLHWDVPIDPAMQTLFTLTAAAGYATSSFVFDEDYLFKGWPDANVAGTSETIDGAVEWLRAHRGGPFAMWFHSWATHMPYDVDHSVRHEWLAAKEEIIASIQSDTASGLEGLREAYRGAVEYQSEVLFADFLGELDRLGLREDTVVVFLSDHGESWGERFADKQAVKGTFHMHGATLYDEIVQIPLILSAPGLDPAVVRSQVRSIDLLPTLLELAGLPVAGGDGASLLPLLDGREQGDRPALMVGSDRGALSLLGLREPPWKVVVDVRTGEEEAYRLDLDPRERTGRSDELPHELRERLYAEVEGLEHHEPSGEEVALVESRLADLGYL